ncbi:MAG: trigger factor [Candidatus Midichloriaceae bacterium]|jgi:trigger factor
MKIDEIKNEGFIKEFQVTIPFEDINKKIEEKVLEAAKTFKMPGFREGKVPVSIVRQKVGKEERGKEIQNSVSKAIAEIVTSKKLSPASTPNVEITSFDEEKGLSIKIAITVLPEIPEIKWDAVEVEKVNIKISKKEIDDSKNMILKDFRTHKKAGKEYTTALGDKVVIDFHGKIDGKEFDGNKAEKMELVIGDNKFLYDFEKNLVGCKKDEEKSFEIEFPKDYPNKDLISKKATFDVKICEVMELEKVTSVTPDMLKKLGVESEEKLVEFIKNKIKFDFDNASRMRMKKELFDKVDAKYDFDVPQEMLDQDFEMIWKDVEKNRETNEELKKKSIEDLQKEYKKISKRRVKLGLIMADIARKNNILVSDDEIREIVNIQANQNPEIKEKMLQYYQSAENLEKIRGPILEEKTMDLLLTKIKIKEVEMTSEDFIKKVLPEVK